MKYIYLFGTEENHNSVYKSSAYIEPWVAYIEKNKKCTYNKPPQYLIGTATSEFTPNSGAFSGYTFTSPSFKVKYTGNTLTDLSKAFYKGYSYNTGDIGYDISSITESTLDTSNVTDMHNIFQSCYNLTTLDLSDWKTSNVTDMRGMFLNCLSLKTLDISHFDTSSVTNMKLMFRYCSNLTEVKVINCSTETQQKISGQVVSDLSSSSYTWTLTDGVITRSNKS